MPKRLRQCVEEQVLNYAHAHTQDTRGEISDLLASTRKLDTSLANDLEVVIHLYAADSAIAGFMLGWDYSENPAAAIYVSVDKRCWPSNSENVVCA